MHSHFVNGKLAQREPHGWPLRPLAHANSATLVGAVGMARGLAFDKGSVWESAKDDWLGLLIHGIVFDLRQGPPAPHAWNLD